MKIAAFYDIDGTLYREGLITEVFKKFVTHELVDASKWHDVVKPTFMKYDRRQGEYDDYLKKMVDIYRETLIGLSNEHIRHIANLVIQQKGERVYTFTRDEIIKHKEESVSTLSRQELKEILTNLDEDIFEKVILLFGVPKSLEKEEKIDFMLDNNRFDRIESNIEYAKVMKP